MGKDSQFQKQKFQTPLEATSKQGYFEDIRKKMLAGEKLPECSKCWREEAHRGYSYRTLMENRLKIQDINPDAPFDLKYLEIFFSNLCNLSCRMCDITQSSQWANLYNGAFVPEGMKDDAVDDEYLDENGRAKVEPMNFDLALLDKIDLSNLIEVKILGGEPMITPDHLVFLRRLMQDSKHPEKIKLVYHTNVTKRPPQMVIDFWKKMQQIEIVCSIDGYSEVNEYQRIGHKWKVIEENVAWYRQLDANIELRIHSTLTPINIWRVHDLVSWTKNIVPSHKVTFDFAMRPHYLDVSLMPDDAKQKCKEVLDSSTALNHSHKRFILAYLDTQSYNKEHWKEFWKKMEAIDKYTNQSLSAVAPQLEAYKI
jgi:organic radical activating enzyme